MDRREAFSQLAAGAAGLALSSTLLAKAETNTTASPLLDAAWACQKSALNCQKHCIELFEAKDTSMLACFKKLNDLIALNEAGMELFAHHSPLAKEFAGVLQKASDSCALECGKHAKHHEVCASCQKACEALSKALKTEFA